MHNCPGIHYDAIMLEDAFGVAISKFSCKNQPEILDMALELAKQANSRLELLLLLLLKLYQ